MATATSARKLTPEQLTVVHYDAGHAIVEAVPGSGKTTVLVARLRRLVKIGRDPTAILAVMFNKAAQVGFEARMRAACPNAAALPDIRTFHSVGYQILKRLVTLGALPAWQLHTGGGSLERFARQTLRYAWTAANGQGARPTSQQFQEFLNFITLVKAGLDGAAAVFKRGAYAPECRPYIDAFNGLLHLQAQRKVMFFDDLIHRPMMLLAQQPELWRHFSDRYDEILVDEAQDINDVQFFMVKGLAGSRARVIAVGDPNQSIYKFRGAKISVLTNEFAQAFSPCQHFPMSRSFRFGHRVALLANHLIERNTTRSRSLVVAAPGNPNTTLEQIELDAKKPSGVVDLLTPYWKAGKLRQCAMLGRNFSHLVPYEIELAEAGVPYHVYGRKGLLFLPEIATLVCAVSLVADRWVVPPDDRYHFIFSLLTTPTPYVAHEVLEAVADAMEPNLSGDARRMLPQILRQAAARTRVKNPRAATSLTDRADTLQMLVDGSLANVPAANVVAAYIEMTGMRDMLQRGAATPEQGKEAVATLDAFVGLAERSGTVEAFLDLLGPLAAHKEDKPPAGDHCMLTTLHRSKGLEWSLVMVVGLVNGVFPDESSDAIEEERRLAFVGFTRAIDRLVLFHPADRTLANLNRNQGALAEDRGPASRFLYEGEVGFSRDLAGAITGDQPVTLPGRRSVVANAYLQEVAAPHVTIALDPAARAAEEASRHATPIVPGKALKVGEKAVHASYGLCEVTQIFHAPVYRLRLPDGKEFNTVVNEANGWGRVAAANGA